MASIPGKKAETERPYALDDQIGFILRKVSQRHTAIFSAAFGNDVTAPQWAALAKLYEIGPTSQNLLGRMVALDAATIKGVVDRLSARGLIETSPDPDDARRIVVALTETGRAEAEKGFATAQRITEETLAPLNAAERAQLLALLKALS
ncbi:MarR family winged helix-turn-helix transcriptional regulator [Dongia sp.]|uniref:MarR family winged helix-turn-helix transcriptional regulator n=1 Tax=Dongia sp. TaxID=1977262 RepID=UPI0035B1586E